MQHPVDILVPAYAPWPVSRYELELVVSQSNKNRELIVISCDGSLSFCPIRDLDKNFTCKECQAFRAKQIAIFERLTQYKKVTTASISRGIDIEATNERGLEKTNREIYSKSTAMTVFKSKDAAINNPSTYQKILQDYDLGYNLGSNFFKNYNVVNCTIFNARISFYRAFFDIARKVGNTARVYEVPMIGEENFIVTENYSIVDRNKWSIDLLNFVTQMKTNLSHSQYQKKCDEAQKWFEDRVEYINSKNSGAFANKPYLAVTAKNKLPSFIASNPELQLVSYFVSSDFELVGIPEIENSFQTDQFELVSTLAKWADEGHFKLVIRLHPNMSNSPVQDIELYGNLSRNTKFIEVVMPSEDIDSYALAKASDHVVTSGSTIGLEAAYLGMNTTVCGASHYSAFNIARHVSTIDELMLVLKQPNEKRPELSEIQGRCLDMIISLKYFNTAARVTHKFQGIVFYHKNFSFGSMIPTISIVKKIYRRLTNYGR